MAKKNPDSSNIFYKINSSDTFSYDELEKKLEKQILLIKLCCEEELGADFANQLEVHLNYDLTDEEAEKFKVKFKSIASKRLVDMVEDFYEFSGEVFMQQIYATLEERGLDADEVIFQSMSKEESKEILASIIRKKIGTMPKENQKKD